MTAALVTNPTHQLVQNFKPFLVLVLQGTDQSPGSFWVNTVNMASEIPAPGFRDVCLTGLCPQTGQQRGSPCTTAGAFYLEKGILFFLFSKEAARAR